VQQHLIDSNEICDGGQSVNCFDQLQNCITQFNIDGALSSIRESVDRVSSSMTQIGSAGSTLGTEMEKIFPGSVGGAGSLPSVGIYVTNPTTEILQNVGALCSHTKFEESPVTGGTARNDQPTRAQYAITSPTANVRGIFRALIRCTSGLQI